MSRVMNFNAGPAALPLAVLERAKSELVEFEGSGMSVMEHSHRGKVYEKVHADAMGLLVELLELPADYDILFVTGGASTVFAQLPLNFLGSGAVADYIVTGTWGEKALAEAETVASVGGGKPHVCATTLENKSYARVPKQSELSLSDNAAYVHVTSNETIHGVEWALGPDTPFPTVRAPLICDMSSDILGRRIDATQFDLIYAGAQKNIGPSGVTIIAAKKELIGRGRKDIPTIFQYRTHAANKSLYNTPPTFGIYLMRNTLEWLKSQGGVAGIEARNRKKAQIIYDAVDASGGFYRCPVDPSCRSIMNVVFRLPSPELDDAFVKESETAGMVGLKGHRAVGGIRASIYNAAEIAWSEALASFMKDFAKRRG